MRKIYTGLDIASDGIKIVFSELFNNKFHVLASTSVSDAGIKKGLIVNREKTVEALDNAIKNIESTIGIRIDEAVVTIPSNDRKLSVVSGTTNIIDNEVTGEDIMNCLSEASINRVEPGYELVTSIPIAFEVDGVSNISNPRGRVGNKLTAKAVMVTVPKENLFSVLEVCSLCGVEAKDAIFRTIGDYYETKAKDIDREIGAIVNIGSDIIDVSIFNKGIIIKNDIINLGSKNIDKDISYVYGVNLNVAEDLKDNFSVCSRKYADSNDVIDINLTDTEMIKINQYELSEVVEARVTELLKLAKKSINNLTNRKISYIIVTGSITELTGFSYVVENVLGINSSTLNITTLGIRNNKFSSAIGIIKYYYDKLKLRDINSTMIEEEKLDNLMSNKKNLLTANNDTFVSKIFDYFTSN